MSLVAGEGSSHSHSINAFLSHRDEPRLGVRLAQYSNLPFIAPSRSRRDPPATSLLHNFSTDYGSLAALTTASSAGQTSSVSTSYGVDRLPARILELDHQGALQVAPIRDPPVYECPFDKLGCRRLFTNSVEWRNHSMSHFVGVEPPRTNHCCFCEKKFTDSTGWRSWTCRMEHIELHHRLSHRLAIARTDLSLYRYLYDNSVIGIDIWNELRGSSVNRSHVSQACPLTPAPAPSAPLIQMNGPRRQERPRRGR